MNATSPPPCPTCGLPPPGLLTPPEADRLLNVPRGRAARLARRGLLPSVELPDGTLRFPADLLDRLPGRGTPVAAGPLRLVPAPEPEGGR